MRPLHALFFLLSVACSRGEFQDDRDYFQSVYGLSLQPYALVGSTYIGRVVDTDERPLPLTKIYLKGSPLYTTSNHKGGFYLTGLLAGKNTLYIVAANGLGRTIEVEWAGDRWMENNRIVLDSMIRVSGRVMSGAAPVSEARILVDGSPFSALSDASGQYVLEMPRGSYRLKAQHLLYNPFEWDEQRIDQDLMQDLNLDPLGFPTVDLSFERSEGGIIRGLTAQINVKMSAGVRYMRVINHSSNLVESELTSSRWIDVKKQLVLEHKGPGMNYLSLQFMDQFGKMSDPLGMSYYMTLLDSSWRLIYGRVTSPLLIRAHEKVAFLNFFIYGSGAGNSSPGFPAETVPGEPPSASTGSPMASTTIEATVEIEGGAALRGAAQFQQSILIKGTAENPVTWDLRDEEGQTTTATLHQTNHKWEHVQMRSGYLQIFEGNWHAEHLAATDLAIQVFRSKGITPQDIVLKSSDLLRSSLRVPVAPEGSLDLHVVGNNFRGEAADHFYLTLPASVKLLADENYFEFKDRIVEDLEFWKTSFGRILDEPILLRQNSR